MENFAVAFLTILGVVVGVVVGLLVGTRWGRAEAESTAALELASKQAELEAGEHHWRARLDEAESRSRQAGEVASLVTPLRATLSELQAAVARADHTRATGMGRIEAQLATIEASNRDLAKQTSGVAAALRNPGLRGKWGEVQLTRIVQSAGLLEGVTYRAQPGEAGGRLRPDMIIDLGAGRRVVIDAKVPLAALLEAEDSDAEPSPEALKAHALAVRSRIKDLAGKDYAAHLAETPDFVVLFLPADDLLAAALRADPQIVDHAGDAGVILATPSTLMALLRVVALAWQEDRAAAGAEEILTLAQEAVSRVGMLAGHLQLLGTRLDATLAAYNKVVGSWQSRIRPVSRRLSEHGSHWDGIADLAAIDTDVRRIDPLHDTG